VALGLAALSVSCAPRPLRLPSGPGEPFPAYAEAYAAATRECAAVRTLTAELALSGRAGRAKLRGRVLIGVARPASIRIEGLAPFGAPMFILVADRGRATLLLPRDNRVLRDTPPAAIVEALTGVPLGPDELRAALGGCGVPVAAAASGRRYGASSWAAIDLASGATVYLWPKADGWAIAAVVTDRYSVEYDRADRGRPARVRLRTTGDPRVPADLTAVLSQVEINTDLDPAAFRVEVPPEAEPLTLDELQEIRGFKISEVRFQI
jgi:hypothetical protein